MLNNTTPCNLKLTIGNNCLIHKSNHLKDSSFPDLLLNQNPNQSKIKKFNKFPVMIQQTLQKYKLCNKHIKSTSQTPKKTLNSALRKPRKKQRNL
jgi:hypothetical protein